jgi:D-glycero-alpha-D-manno-heptose 1-phosphate guanylyltransferase
MTDQMIHKGPEQHSIESVDCIILAGGLGTRLRSEVPDLPKCMAPISGRPFLEFLINNLIQQGVKNFIFSLGYMHEVIEDFLKESYPNLSYKIVIENEPLGTGGAIALACKNASTENVIIMNGDTMFKINISELINYHINNNAQCSLSLKPMNDFDRYGVVEINKDGCIQSFNEKKFYKSGLINGGVYAINRKSFLSIEFPEKFSFEKDYLEKYYNANTMLGLIQDEYFIDIGIPEDFKRAGIELTL